MITRLPKNPEPYLNFIEIAQLLIMVEFLVAMETIRIYNKEDGAWNKRRIFWYLMGAVPFLTAFIIITIASFKYIVS